MASPRTPSDPLGAPPAARAASGERVPWLYFLAFLVGTALVVVAIWYTIENERRAILTMWRSRVATVADDRVRFVESWLAARQGDAEVLATSPIVRARLKGEGAGEAALVKHLTQLTGTYGYASIWVFDPRGRLVARSSGAPEPGASIAEAAAAVRDRKDRIDLIDEAPDRRILSISVPVFAEDASLLLGVVTLTMAPEAGLFPLLSEDGVSTRTGETLLFRADERGAVYLSPFRHPPGEGDAVGRSLEAIAAHVKASAMSHDSFAELIDYRAVRGLAAIRRVAPTSWGLVFKVDRKEALAEFRRAGQLAGAAAAFLLLALAGLLISLWRQQQRGLLMRAQMEQERAIFNLRGYAETIVACMPSGLLLLDADLRVLAVNPAFLDGFHLHRDDVLGRELAFVVRAEGLIPRAHEVLATGNAQRDVLLDLHLRQRQESRPVLITLTAIRMAEQDSARLLLIVQDLTEEERLQAARMASEQRFRDLVQGLDAIVWEADAGTLTFSFVSQRAEVILGYGTEHWLREPDFFVTRVHPDDRVRVVTTCRDAVARGLDHELEYRALTADGHEVRLRDIVHVRLGPSGRAIQLRGVTVDLTEHQRAEEALRQTEEQLRQAQKMDAVGKLAGGIAHDFNNLLMVIRGDSDLMLRRLSPEDPLRAHAERTREAADQAATLTRKLLAFSRKQVLAPVVLDVNQIVGGLHTMLDRLLGETIHLVTVTAPNLGSVKADPGQVEQILLNLAVNARDAMPDGGRLTIQTADRTVGEDEAARYGIKPGPYVMLEVKDTGVGMDADVMAHVFEPFFTTKGHGTGLGLSTVYGIVNQSGGHTRVDSEPGKGTTFQVFLPRVEVAARAAAAVPATAMTATGTPPHRSRGEIILLVEDAERVRAVVREILEMQGYELIEARHGAEALMLEAAHKGPIHLLITDVVMPEMSGRELAQRLLPLRPEMGVLYISGYTDDAIVRHGVLEAGMALLPKPFTPDALAAKVREILDTPRSSPTEAAPR